MNGDFVGDGAGRMDHSISPARSSVDTFGTSIAMRLLGLVSTIVIARALGPAGKGRFDLFVAVAMMLALFTGLSLHVGITYVVARGRAHMGSLFRQVFLFVVVQGVVVAAIVAASWGLGFLRRAFEPVPPGLVAVSIVALVVLASAWASSKAVLLGRREIVGANRRDLLVNAVGVASIIGVLVVARDASLRVQLSALFCAGVVVSAIAVVVFVAAARGPDGPSADRRAFGEALRFSLPAYLGNIFQMANYRLDLVFVVYFAGVAQVGIYSLAVAISHVVWLAPLAMATVILPSTAAMQHQTQQNAARAAQGARVAFWGSLLLGGLLLASGAVLVPLIFGRGFGRSFALLAVLLPGTSLLAIGFVLAAFVAGMGKPRLNLYVYAASFVVTIGLDLALIPHLGAMGASIASSASYAMSALLLLLVFRRLSGVGVAEAIFLRRGDLRQVMAATRAAIARRAPR